MSTCRDSSPQHFPNRLQEFSLFFASFFLWPALTLFQSCSSNSKAPEAPAPVTILVTSTATSTATATPTRDHTAAPTPTSTATWALARTLGQYGTTGMNGDFQFPTGVAAGAGYIAVNDLTAKNTQVFNSTGTYLYSIPAHGGSASLYGAAMDSDGELYVCDYNDGEVDGYLLGPATFTYDFTWTGQGNLAGPVGVRIDPQGNLVVVDSVLSSVKKLDWADDSVLKSASLGSTIVPSDLALDRYGRLYVVDNSGSGIAEYDSNFQFLNEFYGSGTDWGGLVLSNPIGIEVDFEGNLVIADQNHYRVVRASPEGKYLGQLNGLNSPTYLTIDSAGKLYVSDRGLNQLLEFAH